MYSLFEARRRYRPHLPEMLSHAARIIWKETEKPTYEPALKELFPHLLGKGVLKASLGEALFSKALKVGVIFSGGQAPGGHNVIAGLFDTLKTFNTESRLLGFLNGPQGVIDGKYKELHKEEVDAFRNIGGFHLIGSGRTKIETDEQLKASLETAQKTALDALVIIGGDDSNTNAAILAEYFLRHKCSTSVLGVPKTIDGDLRNGYVDISFGFDTACKTYSEMIGNIAHDALSAKKYYHFIKLMGRSASHIALECALRTHPNFTLISEEAAEKKMTLEQIRDQICELICKRADEGKNYGLILIPEGLVEFIPAMRDLIKELNAALASEKSVNLAMVKDKLSLDSRKTFSFLPEGIQKELLLDRDPHGNVQVSKISTEKLLLDLVEKELSKRKKAGTYKGKFSAVDHFFGYEGRSGFPSNFDADYCCALGMAAALLAKEKATGYMAAVKHLDKSSDAWELYGVPLTSLMHLETRKGKSKPVIAKALVDLKGGPFTHFAKHRDSWAFEDKYLCPGPIQFFGDDARLTDAPPCILLIK